MKLEWTLDPPGRQPACEATSQGKARVKCELPWDHIVGRNHVPMKWEFHMGRNRVGSWYTWK